MRRGRTSSPSRSTRNVVARTYVLSFDRTMVARSVRGAGGGLIAASPRRRTEMNATGDADRFQTRCGAPRGIRIVTPGRQATGFPSTSADMPPSIGTITTSYPCGPGVTSAPGAYVTWTAWNPPRSTMTLRVMASVDCVGGACSSIDTLEAMRAISIRSNDIALARGGGWLSGARHPMM